MPPISLDQVREAASADSVTLLKFIQDNQDSFPLTLAGLFKSYDDSVSREKYREANALREDQEAKDRIDQLQDEIHLLRTQAPAPDILDILKRTFGNKFSQEEAFVKIENEKQGNKPTAEFLSTYLALATASGSQGFDCTQRLLLAVHPTIRDRVLTNRDYSPQISLHNLADLILEADNINRSVFGEHYVKKSSAYTSSTAPTPTSNYQPFATAVADTEPMELDAIKIGNKVIWTKKDVEDKTWAKTGAQKNARRKYQIDHSLCFYCDADDHDRDACPKLKAAKKRKAGREAGKA